MFARRPKGLLASIFKRDKEGQRSNSLVWMLILVFRGVENLVNVNKGQSSYMARRGIKSEPSDHMATSRCSY